MRRTALLVVTVLVTATIGFPGRAVGAPRTTTAGRVSHACDAPVQPGRMQCFALVRSGATSRGLRPDVAPAGYGPREIQDAYDLPAGGDGVTVAIVDAFDNPNAEADLAVWRAQYGLPPCTTANGCFRKIDQRGGNDYPVADPGWAVEISLDLDAVSAACPACHLLLVESDDNMIDNLGTAVNQAVAQGAQVVSNSYGGSEDPSELDFDQSYFDHPGVAITVSSGDSRYGVQYPAASQFVTAVGGTSLVRDAGTARGWRESVWDYNGGPGSGCSGYGAKPSWQTDTGCDMRTVADVSADADPNTGLAVYDSFQKSGWVIVGGTSLAAPLVAGVYALAGRPGTGDYPSSYPYSRTGALNDVTSGSNGTCDPSYLCTAGPGYDGPTGLGSPAGVTAFAPLGPHGDVAGAVTDAATGAPLAGVTVRSGAAKVTTDASGRYDLTLPAGSQDVTATKFGYDSGTAAVTVTEGGSVDQDFTLTAQPRVTLHGTVIEGSDHGWPLAATITVAGMPDGVIHTDPVTGNYSVSLPQDATYTLSVTGEYPGLADRSVDVTLGDADQQRDIALSADKYRCTAPGYQSGDAQIGYEQTFDDTSAPAGWTVVDNEGNGQVWSFDNPGNFGNRTGSKGGFAAIYSGGFGGDGQQDTSLVSPVLDLSADDNPAVWFNTDYSQVGNSTADVDVSVDGGTTWTNAWRQSGRDVSRSRVQVPIPQAAGRADVQVRFHYTAAADLWWQVDDVAVGRRVCTPVEGGLVLGQVHDRNTGVTLSGASVARTVTDADGAYWLFSPGGVQQFSAAMPRYVEQTRSVAVGDDQTNQVDFSLAAGRLALGRRTVTVGTTLGGSASATVTVRNNGTAPATIDAAESPDGAAPFAAMRGAPLQRVRGHFALGPARRQATRAGAAVKPAALPWTSTADYPSAIWRSGAGYHDGTVYTVGGVAPAGPTRASYAYSPRSAAWTRIADLPVAREAPAAGFLGARLYVAGGWSTTGQVRADADVYDPHTNTWSPGPAMAMPVAAAGSAVVDGKLYVVGGCQSSCGKKYFQSYDPVTRQWSVLPDYPTNASFLACGGIDGMLYCAGGGSDNGGSPGARSYVFDPSTNTWTRLADLPIELWGSGYTVADGMLLVSGGVTDGDEALTNQGFAYHPDTDTWTALPNSNEAVYGAASTCGFYKIGGASVTGALRRTTELLPGYTACDTGDPVPWLAESPSTVTIAPGASEQLTVRMDADRVSRPGTYTATVDVRSDTPYATGTVHVSMTVAPPASWATIVGTIRGRSCNGAVAVLPGATVVIHGRRSDYTLRTDANGRYTLGLPETNTRIGLTVAKSGWFPADVTAWLRPGGATVKNVTLDRTGC